MNKTKDNRLCFDFVTDTFYAKNVGIVESGLTSRNDPGKSHFMCLWCSLSIETRRKQTDSGECWVFGGVVCLFVCLVGTSFVPFSFPSAGVNHGYLREEIWFGENTMVTFLSAHPGVGVSCICLICPTESGFLCGSSVQPRLRAWLGDSSRITGSGTMDRGGFWAGGSSLVIHSLRPCLGSPPPACPA